MKKKNKYKSLLERDFAAYLKEHNIPVEYEKDKFAFMRPSHYIPDWKLSKTVYLETKGEFAPAQRKNLLAFLEQHPKIQIIMVFAQANNKLNKNSKMTYGQWCEKNGVKYHNLDAVWNSKSKQYTFKNPLPMNWYIK